MLIQGMVSVTLGNIHHEGNIAVNTFGCISLPHSSAYKPSNLPRVPINVPAVRYKPCNDPLLTSHKPL